MKTWWAVATGAVFAVALAAASPVQAQSTADLNQAELNRVTSGVPAAVPAVYPVAVPVYVPYAYPAPYYVGYPGWAWRGWGWRAGAWHSRCCWH
jgi:hypothetical protein